MVVRHSPERRIIGAASVVLGCGGVVAQLLATTAPVDATVVERKPPPADGTDESIPISSCNLCQITLFEVKIIAITATMVVF